MAAAGLANAQTDKATTATTTNIADNSLPCVVDLTPYYIKKFKWRSKGGFTGHQVIDGLPFEMGGECILYGKDNADRNSNAHSVSKMEVTGIKIGRKFDELHLIHSVQWREYYGCPVAILRLDYADRTSHDFEIRYNYQVLDWNRLLSEGQEIMADPDTKIIWRSASGAGDYKGTGRLFKSVLKNPFPDKEVVGMDIISTRSRSSYVLEAATVAKSDPHREVTAAMPLNQPAYQFDGTLTVTVLDKETGAPIVGAEVNPYMSVENAGVVADPIRTSADGVARVKYPVSRTSYVGVEVSKRGYAGRRGHWPSNGIPTEITYRLVTGCEVVGHWKRAANLATNVNLADGQIMLQFRAEPPPVPKELDSQEKVQAWFKEWLKTEAGKDFTASQREGVRLELKADGTLHGEAIEPGNYILSGNFWGQAGNVAEVASREVVIPKSSPNSAEAPFDIGEVLIKAVKHLNTGELAPDFSVKTLDDQPLKLADFKGKYVLLDFWATWCGPCVAETPHMKAAYDAYGSNPCFVMISLSLDHDTDLPKKFAQSHEIKWLQGFLGDWGKDTVTKDYCVRGIPSIFLIGPDGKIIAQNLRGEAIKNAIGSALGAK